jgi:hypothetical protein
MLHSVELNANDIRAEVSASCSSDLSSFRGRSLHSAFAKFAEANQIPRLKRHFPFAFSPSSTRRRMASERVVPFAVAHAAIATTTSVGTRAEISGSWPVAGRPLGFLCTDIAFFIFPVYTKGEPAGSVTFAAGSNSSQKGLVNGSS